MPGAFLHLCHGDDKAAEAEAIGKVCVLRDDNRNEIGYPEKYVENFVTKRYLKYFFQRLLVQIYC